MAKHITQKTFDDIVLENMSEFEMEPEEAIQDAVKQFESQGVSLSNIVIDPSLYSSEKGEAQDHPVITAVKTLSASLNDSNDSIIVSSLNTIHAECDIDLARRCLAGSHGAYACVLQAMKRYRDTPDHLVSALSVFCSLVNGQPDLMDSEGYDFLISLVKQYKANTQILELTIRAVRLNCVKHEGNRQEFIERELIILLTELLTLHKPHAEMIKEVAICLRSLTLDDDVRVPFGKAHENAKTIVTEGEALKAILELCEEHMNTPSVLAELFLTLGCLAVRDEFCHEVLVRGGVRFIVNAFKNSINDKTIVRQALTVLKVLAGNDEVKHEIAKLEGVELAVSAMITHAKSASIAEAVCKVLTAITLRNAENCQKVVECEGHQHIVQAMRLHPGDVGVQKNACMALRNLVSRSKEFTDQILSLGTERLLNEAMTRHEAAQDEAKAALRDLGCKVELKELWKGERGTIQ
ncbi:armadillo repeat-containing protein 6-like [Biomphalaria glabrata]|uniref:Armadillo repeat-containing protein 6-like n=1 Tax=Biomphalaria glabrata TaxID=6526 RepID=A0A9U8EPD5_BIOGL|nr:armadillo repeat-containing protein 6-like [Biomphalaria glabrata]XP_013096625.2 armadillo repeat-containing protein 6-like [Biomphalaria glabrata]XP_055867999.1 armadillo repeat-containing protein 6-like [Biomphalaria glabrata]XP_055868009.1 armadillo repeat-containing protein 6-like [Biomphalaria glabrata]